MKLKSLEQMEVRTAVTPKGAVLLWLARYVKDNRAVEHMTGLEPGVWGDGFRTQVREQLEAALRAEMRGETPERIDAAVRQAKMEADFLMLLATETERHVCSGSVTRRLEIDLATERLRNAKLRGAAKEKMAREAMRECTPEIRSVAKGVLGEKLMCDMIRHAYFDGQPIMLETFPETLEDAVKRVEELMASHDRQAEEKIEGEEFRSEVRAVATWQSKMFEMTARMKMLNEFGEHRATLRLGELHMPSLMKEMAACCLKSPVKSKEQATGSEESES